MFCGMSLQKRNVALYGCQKGPLIMLDMAASVRVNVFRDSMACEKWMKIKYRVMKEVYESDFEGQRRSRRPERRWCTMMSGCVRNRLVDTEWVKIGK